MDQYGRVNGGQEKTVNRKYLLLDPLAEAVSDSGDDYDGSSEDDFLIMPSAGLRQDVGTEKVEKPPGETRSNKRPLFKEHGTPGTVCLTKVIL